MLRYLYLIAGENEVQRHKMTCQGHSSEAGQSKEEQNEKPDLGPWEAASSEAPQGLE